VVDEDLQSYDFSGCDKSWLLKTSKDATYTEIFNISFARFPTRSLAILLINDQPNWP